MESKARWWFPVVAGLLASLPAAGEEVPGRPRVAVDARTARAVERALAYLAATQNPDGSWTDGVGRKVHNTYQKEIAPHVGVTALAGMAFLSAGTLPREGPVGRRDYCETVRKALDYIIRNTGPTGFISANNSRMYSHAFASLFLAEAYGCGFGRENARVQECLRRAVRLIVDVQNDEGGWRYRPGAVDSDMSITVCQVMALRAARNAGIHVPRRTIRRAVDYVKRSFVPSMGAFTYQLGLPYRGLPSRTSFALTAAGVTTLYGAGEYSAYEIREGLRYMWNYRPLNRHARHHFDYFYGQYYAVQAAFQAGGEYWRRWYEYIRDDLLEIQEADGSWRDLVGPNYATAMAAIILQLPNQYLPITEN